MFFTTDQAGRRESKETLRAGGKWLWFRPDVIAELMGRRGGGLGWHTRDTGGVSCGPGGYVRFGVNRLDFVNVYAKDIAVLPEWQQRIWAGFSVAPDGGVSDELLASQARGIPASTKAPEVLLREALAAADEAFSARFGAPLFRGHPERHVLMERAHRFRGTDQAGVFALAKDLARLTADSIDARTLQSVVAPPKNEHWRSLKSLEKVLATVTSAEEGRRLVGTLVGVYELRLADAHLPSGDIDTAFESAGVDRASSPLQQAVRLIERSAEALNQIAAATTATRA